MRFIVVVAALALAACNPLDGSDVIPTVAPVLTSADAADTKSYAHPLEARVTHVDLNLDLNFTQHQVSGKAVLDIEARPDAREIVLDDRGLDIVSITDGEGNRLKYAVGVEKEDMGSPLAIQIGKARKVVITYSATDAAALQWLSPEQPPAGCGENEDAPAFRCSGPA